MAGGDADRIGQTERDRKAGESRLGRVDQRQSGWCGGRPRVSTLPFPRCQAPVSLMQYDGRMLRYHVAFHLPRAAGEVVVAEALDFPGAVTQGIDLPDARQMISSAMEDLAECLLEEGRPLPIPDPAAAADADLIELVPLSVHVGAPRA